MAIVVTKAVKQADNKVSKNLSYRKGLAFDRIQKA